MAFLKKSETVLKQEGISIGEFDISVEGLYRNVLTIPFKVKRNRSLYIDVAADPSVDVAVANDKGSGIFSKQNISKSNLGPIPTGESKEMGLILGVYPGDKAIVDIKIRMEKE